MTLEVYTQVLQRKDRELYTEAFDRLMADAIPSTVTLRTTAESSTEAGGFTGIPAS